ncbi:MAG TPA: DUF58 domain-containing protein [Tepidisphaeraceae bacterium]|jgi:uncharacterized protein (DUF58 family)|nr:DUF58 domain-containing protein [Tepidisphaeraceae bacterium]
MVSRFLDPNLIQSLNHLTLSARRVVEGSTTGQHRSPLKGSSIEFRQHRFYTPGDDPRRLDWRVLARTDRPYIKEYDEETNLRATLLLDASGSMAFRGNHSPSTKFDYAAKLTASLSYLMLNQTESVGLALVRQSLESYVEPHAGTPQLARLVDVLERAVPHGPSALPDSLHTLATRLGRRSLVVICSDFFLPIPSLKQSLAHLAHDGHELICLQILDPDELTFPFKTWTRFRGLESESSRVAEPALVRRTYLKNFRAHAASLKQTARALNIEFHRFTTDHPLLDTITHFLRHRAS